MPFVIRNDEKDIQFKLDSVDFFEREYKPKGYRILDPQPLGGTLPERPAKKAEKPKEVEAKADDKKDGKA